MHYKYTVKESLQTSCVSTNKEQYCLLHSMQESPWLMPQIDDDDLYFHSQLIDFPVAKLGLSPVRLLNPR